MQKNTAYWACGGMNKHAHLLKGGEELHIPYSDTNCEQQKAYLKA